MHPTLSRRRLIRYLPPPPSTAAVETNLATPTGHEVSAAIASYTYREPGAQSISIQGAKFVGEYTGTLSLNKRQHWFATPNCGALR